MRAASGRNASLADLGTRLAGLELASPVVVASCGLTETVERMRLAESNGAGAVVMKSLFEEEVSRRSPTPRFAILRRNSPGGPARHRHREAWSLFSYEQASEWGPERYAEEIARAKRELSLKVIASINCLTDEGWASYARTCERAGADAIELNTSCPHGSITFRGGAVEDSIAHVVEVVREAVRLPVIAKLSPMLTAPGAVARLCVEKGANAVTIFNRMTALDIDVSTESPVLHGGYGGHGGAWAIQYALRWVSEIRSSLAADIAGSGGTSSWEDLVKYLLAGANAVQVATAIYLGGFGVIREMLDGLAAWMDSKGYRTLDEFRGAAVPKIRKTHEIDRRHTKRARIDPSLCGPCQARCPAGIPAQGYVRRIAEGRFEEAWRLVAEAAPLGALLAFICPHPCEESCTRSGLGGALAVRALKEFILRWGRSQGLVPRDEPLRAPTGRKVAIVGSGPAGLACAWRLARAGHAVTVFEAMPEPGGMLRWAIPEFRAPSWALEEELARLRRLGVEFRCGERVDSAEGLRARGFDAVFVATGAWGSRPLGAKGERGPGVLQALDLLRALREGETPRLGRTVAVVGGGSTATDAARAALRLGAERVYLVYRRTREEMPAHPEELDAAEAEGIRVLYLAAPRRVVRKGGRPVALECEVRTLGPADATDRRGRRSSEPVGEAGPFRLAADCVVVATGQELADSSAVGLPLERGLLRAEAGTGATGLEGIFAGGDAVSGPATVVEAVASGMNAAAAVDRFLMGESAVLEPIPPRRAADSRAVLARNPDARVEPRPGGTGPLSEDEARHEASRCLACGCGAGCDVCHRMCIYFAVEPRGDRYAMTERCDGCGLCAEVCPNSNIELIEPAEGR